MIAESFPRIRKIVHTSNQVKKSLKLVVESLSTSIKPPIKRHLCGWKQRHTGANHCLHSSARISDQGVIENT